MKFNNTNIYGSLTDDAIERDFERVKNTQIALQESANQLDVSQPDLLANWLHTFDQAMMTLHDIGTYAALERVVDSTLETAEKLEARAGQTTAGFEQVAEPIWDRLMQLNDASFDALLTAEAVQPFQFLLSHKRAMAAHRLSVKEETLLQQMSVDGLSAWWEQYSKLAGTLQCTIDGNSVGLASAFNMTMSDDRNTRESAYKAIQNAWREHQDSVVAGLNAINGWRLSEFERRSHTKDMHYLDVACHQSHITRQTLSSLIDSAMQRKHIGQSAIKLMSQWNQITDTKPWDLMAPPRMESGDKASIPYSEALNIIRDAFAVFDPDMADFVTMMDANGWIDAEPTPNRATGAFCTEFYHAKEPRVFMTYEGSMGNVLTLAHELGHAWHAWVLRDLSFSETQYPMTLAETASIFAETLVRQAVLAKSDSIIDKREILWQEAETASALLINIPTRFEFEKSFVEARKQGKVSANQARELMQQAWANWYEQSISEYDDMFWASKLHFSIAEIGFYNYPYLFGYLFALGVYAQKDKQGDNFRFAYRELLKDTGRMSAEACIAKHLDRDIEQTDFWLDSLDIVEQSMREFSTLVESKGAAG